MDLCLYAQNHGLPAAAVADAVGLSTEDVERVFHDIDAKRRATAYLQMSPQLVEPVPEIGPLEPPDSLHQSGTRPSISHFSSLTGPGGTASFCRTGEPGRAPRLEDVKGSHEARKA